MTKPFISIDVGRLRADVERAQKQLAGIGARLLPALERAMVEYAEHLVSEAQQRAPSKTGELRASGTTQGPVREGASGIIVYAGFNKVYARMRDQGGEIRPVRARALFIPLREGVRPGEPGLVWGKDFVLAKVVRQKGTQYFSGVIREQMPKAAELIGKRCFEIAAAGGPS